MKPTHSIVYKDPHHYSAFPDIVRLRNGDLAVVFRECDVHERTAHLDTTSRIVFMRSSDDGRTWPAADKVVVDPGDGIHDLNMAMMSEIGDRLIVNNHRWRMFSLDEESEAMQFEPERRVLGPDQGYPHGFAVMAGTYFAESGDDGRTWGTAARVALPLPDYYIHTGKNGAVPLPDGTHILPFHGQGAKDSTSKFFIVRTRDGGRTWEDPTVAAADPIVTFSEPAVTRLRSGKLLAMLRTSDADGYLYQVSSDDDGRTWDGLRRTELWGHPAHVLQLKSGSIVCAYGYRRKPYGVRVAFSADDGETWEERILREDGEHGDLGYPASVQLEDERILTVYYFHDADGVRFIAGSVYAE